MGWRRRRSEDEGKWEWGNGVSLGMWCDDDDDYYYYYISVRIEDKWVGWVVVWIVNLTTIILVYSVDQYSYFLQYSWEHCCTANQPTYKFTNQPTNPQPSPNPPKPKTQTQASSLQQKLLTLLLPLLNIITSYTSYIHHQLTLTHTTHSPSLSRSRLLDLEPVYWSPNQINWPTNHNNDNNHSPTNKQTSKHFITSLVSLLISLIIITTPSLSHHLAT